MAVMAAPLISSTDLTQVSPSAVAILGNEDVIRSIRTQRECKAILCSSVMTTNKEISTMCNAGDGDEPWLYNASTTQEMATTASLVGLRVVRR